MHSRDQAVQNMFDRIAGRYDLLNRVISFRLDARWRNEVIREVLAVEHPFIIDFGTGTGDLAFGAADMARGRPVVVGLDFSLPMIRLAKLKGAQRDPASIVLFVQASAMEAPFKAESFDAAMTAFVLRNVSELGQFFLEAYRVLKPGGKFVSLDMFPPSPGWFSILYTIYFYRLVPWIGALIAHDRPAYRYLSDSVRQFHSPQAITKLIEQAGFRDVATRPFLRGSVCLHSAVKPQIIRK